MSPGSASASRLGLLLCCLIILGGLIGLLTRFSVYQGHVARMVLVAAAFVVFGLAAAAVRKVTVKTAVWFIIIAGIAFQAIGFTAPPAHSSDIYRYMWDGQVQAAGIDPYLYPPSAAALVPLRNDYLWGPWTATPPKDRGLQYCFKNAHSKRGPAFDTAVGCSRINRTTSPTIYPPVAEAWFTAVYLVAGDRSPTPMQVAMSLCAVLTTLVLLWGLRKTGRDPRLAALWAWCPTAILEVGNDGHSDVLGTLLCAIALIVLATARTRRKTLLGGALIGLAMATKLTPAFVLPATLKRGWMSILSAVAAATFIVYLPHAIVVRRHIIGFFPQYLQQQGYSSGSGYEVVALLVQGKLASVVAFGVLGVVALAVLRHSNPDEPWRGAVYMLAAALVIGTPQFEWYSMLLVMLVALDGRWEWLALSAGAYLANDSFVTPTTYINHDRVWGYGGGLVVALVLTGIRYLRARRGTAQPVVDTPVRRAVPAAPDHAAVLPSAYRAPESRTRRAPASVNGSMRYQDPIRYSDAFDADPGGAGRQASGPGRTGYSSSAGYGASGYGDTGEQRPPWDYEEYRDLRTRPPASDFPTQTDGFPAQAGGFPAQAPGSRASTGGFPPQTGASRAPTGGFPAQTRGSRAPTGGFPPQTRGSRAPTGGFPAQAGGSHAQTGGFATSTSDFPTQTDGLRAVTGGFAAQADEFLSGRRRPLDGRLHGVSEANESGPAGQRTGGLLAGAVSGFLAAGTALGVANLTAAFVRPQASPIVTIGGEFMAHTPSALTNYAAEKFGQNDMTIWLLSMYFTVALIALVTGMLAWRQLPAGVAGIGFFGLYGAFLAYTRPESHATDVIPSVVGSLAGITVLVALTQWTRVRQRSVGARDVVGPLATERSGWAA